MIKKLWLSIPRYIRVIIWLTFINLGILAVRNLWLGNQVFSFLKSNLFIGSLPPLVIAMIIGKYYPKMHNFLFWFLTGLWVLFYPNAPYMISDLIHDSSDPLDKLNPEIIVFDTLIIFSIAMLSIFYGLVSLKIMFAVFQKKYNYKFACVATGITLLLSCLGFYMGREIASAVKLGNGYLYSWEIFLEPFQIVKSVLQMLFPISTHKEAWAMMVLFGLVQYMLLIIFRDVSDTESSAFLNEK